MRNAALVLGIIGGVWAMVVGFFGYGYTAFIEQNGEAGDLLKQVDLAGIDVAARYRLNVIATRGFHGYS